MNLSNSDLLKLPGRLELIGGVTPIQRLLRLEAALGREANGVRLFVKRDDLMGLGGGGNKLRKLEFLLGEAQAQGCDTFITIGGIQSNHARLSAAACARTGLACELVLSRVVPREDLEYRRNGNVLLDELFGAKVHELPGTADALAFAKERAAILEKDGHRVYLVGGGGSSPVGSLGYAVCAAEIAAFEHNEGENFRRVVLPNGGSGTHAGLVAGFTALGISPARVRSFAVLRPAADTARITLDLARETLAKIGLTRRSTRLRSTSATARWATAMACQPLPWLMHSVCWRAPKGFSWTQFIAVKRLPDCSPTCAADSMGRAIRYSIS